MPLSNLVPDDAMELSFIATGGNTTQYLSVSGSNVKSSAISTPVVRIYSTIDCYMRQGADPTATVPTGGVGDDFIPAATLLRVGVSPGNKLGFITTGSTGTVVVTAERY
jgi:hypothetical protein